MPAEQIINPVKIDFSGGVNPAVPAHLIGDNQVQSANNIDFSLIQGALAPRLGSIKLAATGAGSPINNIFHNYNGTNQAVGNLYVTDSAGGGYRLVGTSATQLFSGGGTGVAPVGINANGSYTLIASGSHTIKDDGSATTDWIKQIPPTPTITVNTLAPLILDTTGTYTVTDGTFIGVTSNTTTFALDDSNNMGVLMLDWSSSPLNLNLNGTETIGNYGVVFSDLAFSDPTQIVTIGIDFSLGDNTFSNYFHAELDPQNGGANVVSTTGEAFVNSLITSGYGTTSAVTNEDRLNIWSQIAQYNFLPLSYIATVSDSLSPWAIPVTNFSLIGIAPAGTNALGTVAAMRLTVQALGTCTVTFGDPAIYGAVNYPLTDVNTGYTYWQTWATLDANGNKLDESAPSPPSPVQTMQNAQTFILPTGTASGTSNGINASIFYRQGGFMQDAYAVATYTGTAITTITDTVSDISALSADFVMQRNLLGPVGSGFPGICITISEPIAGRTFIADLNNIRWTLPGMIGAFPATSIAQVSHSGDNIQGIIAWNPGMVIVNQDSVYEMYGNSFETGDYTLIKSGAKKGSIAPKTIIRTPYGIPLINMDGISMYNAGYSTDQVIPWFQQRYQDMFKGGGATDPAAVKGNRIPAVNISALDQSSATFRASKMYLSMATGSSTVPNTVFVLDFTREQMWWYTYPFNIQALYADPRIQTVWAGSTNGSLMGLDQGLTDQNDSGAATAIAFSARTKAWTANSDTILENLSVECQGTNWVAEAIYDSTSSTGLATFSNANRAYNTPALNGTFVNNVMFDFSGTSTSEVQLDALYNLAFDLLPEPVKVNFYRTPYDTHNWEADKLWDVAYYDLNILQTGTISAVTFVDNTAVMTNLILGPTASGGTSGRVVTEVAFPPEIYGRIAYTTYTSTNTAVQFKHFLTHYDARNEPAKINYYRTDIESLEENIIDAFDVDINPNGTVSGTCYVDNVAILTATIIGTKRQSYTFDTPFTSYPANLYGRTLYVAYTGTGLKHYNTWFHKRLEPDRWSEYVSPKVTGDEREIKVFKPEINPLGNTVLATTYLSGTAISTHTITGSVRLQYTFSLPVEKYSRTVHAAYQVVPGTGPGTSTTTGRFKHYTTEFEGPVEPPRVTLWRTGPYPYESNRFMKTWSPLLDPISGTVTGTLIVEDTIVNISTFTGNRRQWFTVGIDLETTNNYALFTGSRWEAVYSCSTGQFKHYDTKLESDISPFKKATWSFHYKKLGGATQLDMGRFWSAYVDVPVGPIVGTYWWDIDNAPFSTGTLTFAQGRSWTDRIALPPGARGRLFEFRLYGPNNLEVYNVNMDLSLEGIKGLTRRGKSGNPQDPEF